MQAAWNTGSASDFKFNYKDGGQVKYSSLTPSLNMTECTGYSRKWLPSVKRLVFIHQDPSSWQLLRDDFHLLVTLHMKDNAFFPSPKYLQESGDDFSDFTVKSLAS